MTILQKLGVGVCFGRKPIPFKRLVISLIWSLQLTATFTLAQTPSKSSEKVIEKLREEVQTLTEKVNILESQLKIVENSEKIRLMTEHSVAHEKLINSSFKTLELQLRSSNWKWYWAVLGITMTIVASIAGCSIWLWFKGKIEKEVENRVEKEVEKEAESQVEKKVGGFQQAVNDFHRAITEVQSIKNQLTELHENLVRSILAGAEINEETAQGLDLPTVYEVFKAAELGEEVKTKAAMALGWHGKRCSQRIVGDLIDTLKATVPRIDDGDEETENKRKLKRRLVEALQRIDTPSVYNGLNAYLNHLLQMAKSMLTHSDKSVRDWPKDNLSEQWGHVITAFEKNDKTRLIPAFRKYISTIADFEFSAQASEVISNEIEKVRRTFLDKID